MKCLNCINMDQLQHGCRPSAVCKARPSVHKANLAQCAKHALPSIKPTERSAQSTPFRP